MLCWSALPASLAEGRLPARLINSLYRSAKYRELADQLLHNQFQRALYLESAESSNDLTSEIYAVIHNVSDIDRGVSVGLKMEWDHNFGPIPITPLVRSRQHTDSDLGAQADLRLSAGVYHGSRVAAGLFTQATWAKAKSAGSFYSITPQQSVSTGLPVYDAGSGLLFESLGLLWSVDLCQDWIVVGSMESRHLQRRFSAGRRDPSVWKCIR